MANVELPLGSTEFIPIQIEDRLQNLDTLTGTTVDFRVEDDEGEEVIDWTEATTSGMIALCLVDTNGLAKDEYDLFVRLNLAPEFPILGPFRFEII